MPVSKDFMQSPIEPDGSIRFSGTIERVIYSNEENGFAICELATDADEIVTVTGTLPYIGEGDTVTVVGRWVHNPKYGRQFRVEQCEKELPADQASILRYLSSGAVKGIGPKTAQRIVEEFGDDTFSVMEKHPEWLATIKGITVKRAREIGEEFREQGGFTERMTAARLEQRDAQVVAGDVPKCPECGRPMRKMLAKKGRNAGNPFWSCSTYPDCKGTRPVEEGE